MTISDDAILKKQREDMMKYMSMMSDPYYLGGGGNGIYSGDMTGTISSGGTGGIAGGWNPVPTTAVRSGTVDVGALQADLIRLQGENRRLRDIIENPDIPVARSVKQLLDNISPEEVAGRTSPPFTEANLSQKITGGGPISSRAFTMQTRDGMATSIRVVGLIIRQEGYSNGRPPTTYMVPTKEMQEGDALEAIGDLVSEIILKRVYRQMGENE